MKGIIIYKKKDVSLTYVNWLIDEFLKQGIGLKLIYLEHFLLNGIKEEINFVINKTRNSNISYMFEINNIRVFNKSIINELSANKLKGYYHARNNGLKTSEILLYNTPEKFIRKTIDGHGGEDIYLTNESFLKSENNLCQKFISNVVGDVRFYIVGNKIINAVIRKNSKNFLHNYKKGAKVEMYIVDKQAEASIDKFLDGIYCDYVGIDFLLLQNGELIFNEIEDVCGSRMLSHLNINNTTEEFLRHIKKVL